MKKFTRAMVLKEKNRAGQYWLYDAKKELLYTGISGKIKHRLSSYYQEDDLSKNAHDEKAPLRPKIKYFLIKYMPKNKAKISERATVRRAKPRYNQRLK